MAIEGNVREEGTGGGFSKKQIGLFAANVIAINPDAEEYKDVLGIELKEDSKNTEYLGTNKNGNTYLRIDFWLEELESKQKFKITYFLEDKERINKDDTKKQYINTSGFCTWAANPGDLKAWFTKRDYRVALNGDEDLSAFIKVWLGKLDQWDQDYDISYGYKKFLKGNVKELRDQIGGNFAVPVVALATIRSKVVIDEDSGEEKVNQYQSVWNKLVMPINCLELFNKKDYSDKVVIKSFSSKPIKTLGDHEKFVLAVTGQYGCKESYSLKPLAEFQPADFIVTSNDYKKDEPTNELPF